MRCMQFMGLSLVMIGSLLVGCGGSSNASATDTNPSLLSVVQPLSNPNCRLTLAESGILAQAWAAVRAAGLTPGRLACKTDPLRQPLSFCVSPQVIYSVIDIPPQQLPVAQSIGYLPLDEAQGLQDVACP